MVVEHAMPYKKLALREDRLRPARLLLELARIFNEATYGDSPLGTSLDGLFVLSCVLIGHAENRVMNVSKLAHYLGMTRQTVTRRLNELLKIGIVERTGQYYYISEERNEQPRSLHLRRANNLILAAFREMQRHEGQG